MSKELPYFKFYPNEWITGDITLESMELQGVFVNVCALYWSRNCRVAMAGLKQRYGEAITTLIESGLIGENEGFAVINFLNEQHIELKDSYEKHSKSGKKGAEKRWKNSEANGEANGNPIALRREEKRRKEKIIQPTESEFLEYCKNVLKDKYKPLEFSLKAKYSTWVSDDWCDGHGNKILSWKHKIRNVIPHLKPMYDSKDRTTAFA